MDSRVDRGFLGDQWASAQVGGQVADCRHGECHACGVCDFQQRRPRVYESCAHALQVDQNQPDREFLTYELTYAKVDAARFFGHLEMARHFGRAVRRAGIEIKYSGGYHPMPKISFDNPLPLGVESESEIMRMTVAANSGGAELIDKINPFLPSGLQILTCRLKTPGRSIHANEQDRYRVELSGPGLDPLRVDAFNNSGRWDYTRIRHNGRAQHLDLKTAVVRLTILDEKTIDLVIRADCKPKARPADILQSVFKLKTATIQGARVRKLNPNSERASVDN
jgi:radical SAM-linked protein